MVKKTKQINFRLSEEDYELVKKQSEGYPSLTGYIGAALRSFADKTTLKRFKLAYELADLIKKNQNEMSWAGSNLNQATRQLNEMMKAGVASQNFVYNEFLPRVNELLEVMKDFKKEQIQLFKFAKKT